MRSDQIIYPHSHEDMKALGVTDDDLTKVCLATWSLLCFQPLRSLYPFNPFVVWLGEPSLVSCLSFLRPSCPNLRSFYVLCALPQLLTIVDPAGSITREWKYDDTRNWSIALSGTRRVRLCCPGCCLLPTSAWLPLACSL